MRSADAGDPFQGIIDSLDQRRIVLLDSEGMIAAVNPAWTRFHSRSTADERPTVLGESYFGDILDQDVSLYGQAIRSGLTGLVSGARSFFTMDYRIELDEGEQWFTFMARPLRKSDGGGYMVIHTDITASRTAEERYRLLAEQGVALVMVINREGRPTYVSPAVVRVLGYTEREFISLFDDDALPFVHPVDRADLLEAYRTAVEDRAFASLICRGITKSDETRWVEATFQPLVNELGHWLGTQSRVMDVHEEYTAKLQLQESQQRFDAFMSTTPFSAYMKDEAGRYVYVNSRFEQAFGVEASWICGRTVREWKGDEAADRVERKDRRVLETNRTEEFIDTLTGIDGEEQIWYSIRFPFGDLSGNRYVGGVSMDITERRREELERRRLAAIVSTSLDPIYSTTPDGYFTSWNPAAEKLYGFSAEEMIGQRIELLVPPEEMDRLQALRKQILGGAQIAGFETRRRTRDGRVLDVSLTLSVIHDDYGNVIGASTITRYIPVRKRLLEERQRLYAELREEMNRAAEIQAHLLPRDVPNLPGFEFAAICLPARDVGGDFFDWSGSRERVRLTLGDVTGKGMAAALLMATARASIRSVDEVPVARALTTVNRALSQDLEQSDAFVTLFHAELTSDGRVQFTDAGHGMAFILRSGGDVDILQQQSVPIGIMPETNYLESETTLEPGDILVVYSDGLPDSRPDLSLDEPGQVAALCSNEGNIHQILDRLVSLASGDGPRPDDLTLVLVRRQDNDR
jgi:PAS domain S-box-containing protein